MCIIGIVHKLTISLHIVLKSLQLLDGPYSISDLQNLQFETPDMVYGLAYQFKVNYYVARLLFHLSGTITTPFEI